MSLPDGGRPKALCIGCDKVPEQIREYVVSANSASLQGEEMSAEDYVWAEEGTLNPSNGHFLCTDCYIKAGQPSSRYGWRAP